MDGGRLPLQEEEAHETVSHCSVERGLGFVSSEVTARWRGVARVYKLLQSTSGRFTRLCFLRESRVVL